MSNNKNIHIISRGVIIDEDHILLCKTASLKQNFYFLPGGHIDHAEKAEVALLRELYEEAAIEGNIERFLGVFECKFEPADDAKNNVCHTHEYNLIFAVKAENISYRKQVNCLEGHIEFAWLKLSEPQTIDLRPQAFKKLIPEWLGMNINKGFRSDIM